MATGTSLSGSTPQKVLVLLLLTKVARTFLFISQRLKQLALMV